jgi:hypothetical protein
VYFQIGPKSEKKEKFLSFGNNNNKTFSARPPKRKKQDFHRHKIKVAGPASQTDFASFKERTIVCLDHLGDQLFSEEPGGYSFTNWMNSFNLLLDEFEERAGRQNLPKEYFEKRFELSSSLVRASEPSREIDLQISKLMDEEIMLRNALSALDIKKKLDREAEERRERLELLEAEKNHDLELLVNAKHDLDQKRTQSQESSRLLRRLFGSSLSNSSKTLEKVSVQDLEIRVENIKAKIDGIEKKITEQKKKIEFAEKTKIFDQALGDPRDIQSKLDTVHLRLEEMEREKFERLQMVDKRKEATTIMREIISKIDIGRPTEASLQSLQ